MMPSLSLAAPKTYTFRVSAPGALLRQARVSGARDTSRKDMSVYIVRALGTDFYKIGYTASSPKVRMQALQTGCPYELKLVAWFAGDESDEAYLHRLFGDHRVRGEWFQLVQEPICFLDPYHRDEVKTAHFDHAEDLVLHLVEEVEAINNVGRSRRLDAAFQMWAAGGRERAAQVHASQVAMDAAVAGLSPSQIRRSSIIFQSWETQ